jgi:hypothetical protein
MDGVAPKLKHGSQLGCGYACYQSTVSPLTLKSHFRTLSPPLSEGVDMFEAWRL